MIIVSAGIRPRDELAREAGLKVGERGGVVVNDRLVPSDQRLSAIGEGATVLFTDYVLQEEFGKEDGGALKDDPPTQEELGALPVINGAAEGQHAPMCRAMRKANILDFWDVPPKVINGYFGVAKADGKVRLILDLRRGNLYFKGSKELELLNPAYLVELILEGEKIFLGKTDISNFFHRVRDIFLMMS